MKVNLDDLKVDQQIQLRKRWIDQGTVQTYVDALGSGAEFPPVVAFSDNGIFWLADGFHRIAAYRFCGLADADVDIHEGTRQDAMVYAATANVTNGKPMSQAEKREAGKRLLKLTEWKDRDISRKLGVHRDTVCKWRRAQTGKQKDSKDTKDSSENSEKLPDTIQLLTGNFAKIAQELEPESFDLIITDPPYGADNTHLYGMLAREAERLLKPGASLLAMAGQLTLPAIYNLMQPYLAYHWTISYDTPGGQSPQIWPRKVNTFWKPILWFVKGQYEGVWHGDKIKSNVNDNDKRFHDWGQSESGIGKLVSEFAFAGAKVLDPFLGGGTTAVVCYRLRIPFTGIDIDPNAIETTRERILKEIESDGS